MVPVSHRARVPGVDIICGSDPAVEFGRDSFRLRSSLAVVHFESKVDRPFRRDSWLAETNLPKPCGADHHPIRLARVPKKAAHARNHGCRIGVWTDECRDCMEAIASETLPGTQSPHRPLGHVRGTGLWNRIAGAGRSRLGPAKWVTWRRIRIETMIRWWQTPPKKMRTTKWMCGTKLTEAFPPPNTLTYSRDRRWRREGRSINPRRLPA